MMTTTHRNTTTTTTTTTTSADHEMQLPPPPPPPPLPHRHHDHHEVFHTSKEPTPPSISTSPASSHEELPIDLPPRTTSNNFTTTGLGLGLVNNGNNMNQHTTGNNSNNYRTPPQYMRKTATLSTVSSSSISASSPTTTTATTTSNNNDDFVDLVELASTTLASTIIASKVIQKHSTLLSSSTKNSFNNPSLFSMSQSSIQSDYHPPSTSASSSNFSSSNDNNNNPPQELPKSRTKDDGSLITDADGESQRIITSYIRSISSQIRIVGEESNDEIQISQKGYHYKTWWGVSPGSKRKLLNKEKKDEDYIVNMVKTEMQKRYKSSTVLLKPNSVFRNGGTGTGTGTGTPTTTTTATTSSTTIEDDEELEGEVHDIHHVNAKRISIYVDPLDGTGAYAKGQYEAVTILAGIMLDNIPIFGIIVKPFGHEGCNVNFDVGAYSRSSTSSSSSSSSSHHHQHHQEHKKQQTINGYHGSDASTCQSHCASLGFQYPCSAMYGGTLLGGAYMFSGEELSRSRLHRGKGVSMTIPSFSSFEINESKSSSSSSSSSTTTKSLMTATEESQEENNNHRINNTQQKQHFQRKAIISKSRGGGVVKQCIDSLSSKGLLHPEPIYITGAGYKTMRLLLGTHNETMWFFPKPGTSLWDVAAADALLRVMGGRLSDKFGDDLDYSKSWTDADNLDGIVACSDVDLHAKCIELYHNECWDDEDC